jgi:hypothetical protein
VRPAIRQYEHGDLARILDLWERTGALPVGKDGLSVDQAVDPALRHTRPTLSSEMVDGFNQETERYARY